MQTDLEKLEELKCVVGRHIDYVYEKEHVIWVEGTSIVNGAENLEATIDATVRSVRALADLGIEMHGRSSEDRIRKGLVKIAAASSDTELREWIRDCIS